MKVREFNNYDEFEESGVAGKYEIVSVVLRKWQDTEQVCADLLTNCKRWQTAVKRFFKALKESGNEKFQEWFDGWEEGITECCENGIFKEAETYWDNEKCKSVYDGGYHWEVEDCDGSFYIELTVPTFENERI